MTDFTSERRDHRYEHRHGLYFRTYATLLRSFNDRHIDEPLGFVVAILAAVEYSVCISLASISGLYVLKGGHAIVEYVIPYTLISAVNFGYYAMVKSRMLDYVQSMVREEYLRNRRDAVALLVIAVAIFTVGSFF